MIYYRIIQRLLTLAGGAATSLMICSMTSWAAPVPTGLPEWQCSGSGSILLQTTEQIDGSGQPGDITSLRFSERRLGSATCHCPSDIRELSLFTVELAMPDSDGWIKLNDHLSARLSVFVFGHGNLTTPFFQVQNTGPTNCSTTNNTVTNVASGTQGQLELRVDRSFLGESHFSGELANVYWQFANATGNPDLDHPFIRIGADVTVRTTLSCSFRAGDSFTVDLGSTPINQLNVGAPPGIGYIPRQLDLSVDCTGGTDGDTSGLEFFATATGAPDANGPYIATSKPGIGVAMTDTSGNLLGLGMENGVIRPLQNGGSQTRLQFYPTLVPGQESQVTPGPYNATVTITVTIP